MVELLQRIKLKLDAEFERRKLNDAAQLQVLESMQESLATLAGNVSNNRCPSAVLTSTPTAPRPPPHHRQPLCPPEEILNDLKWDDRKFLSGKMDELARKLATELASRSIFRDDILLKHNVAQENSNYPLLNPEKLRQIEALVKEKLSANWTQTDIAQWRSTWAKCRTAIQTKITNLRACRIRQATAGQLLNLDQSDIPPS